MSSTDLLSAGTSCSHSSCRTIDFLPFKCSHCSKQFCNEHWQPTAHECPSYDPAQYDRVVPQCPFCSKPVNVRPQQDVNEAMERHIDNDCVIFVGKKNRGPVCGNRKCGKSLISPIVCETCRGQFCPAHRMPESHTCVPSKASPSISAKLPAAGVSPAGLAAMKRAADATTSAFASKSNTSNSKSTSVPKMSGSASTSNKPSKPTIIQEMKTDRCESSSSSVFTKTPTIVRPSALNPFASTTRIDSVIPRNNIPGTLTDTRSTNEHAKSSPIDRPRTIIPDPTKKWVPASLFAAA